MLRVCTVSLGPVLRISALLGARHALGTTGSADAGKPAESPNPM
jgi:hypothetical protein